MGDHAIFYENILSKSGTGGGLYLDGLKCSISGPIYYFTEYTENGSIQDLSPKISILTFFGAENSTCISFPQIKNL